MMIELTEIQLNKNSLVPLHEQLRKCLQDAITTGKLKEKTKMPTEEELCTRFDVSRPVVRQAYNRLIQDGYVERMRGRGTFVRSTNFRNRFIDKQVRFADEMSACNRPYRTKMLRQEWIDYTPELFSKMELDQKDRCFHITRIRYVDEKPYVLVENYVPESLCPGLERYNFEEDSLYDTLKSVYGESVLSAHRTIKAKTADEEFARLFGVPLGSPVLYVQNVSFDQMGRPVDYSKEYLDGGCQKIEFDVENS